PVPQAVTMSGSSVGQVARNIEQTFQSQGFRPVTAGKTIDLVQELKAAEQAGTRATAQDVLAVRTALGKIKMGTDPVERAAASIATDKIDTYLSNLGNPRKSGSTAVTGPAALVSDAADRAIANYAVAKRSERITDAVKQAELRAQASGTGGNLDNA